MHIHAPHKRNLLFCYRNVKCGYTVSFSPVSKASDQELKPTPAIEREMKEQLQDWEEAGARGRQPPDGARGVLAPSHLPAAAGGNQRLCNSPAYPVTGWD